MHDFVDLLMPRQWYLISVDLEGMRPLTEVQDEVRERAAKFYELVFQRTT